MAGPLAPTLAQDLFFPLQEELLGVLRGLPTGAWDLPTPSRRWRVREIAAHILDGQLRRISAQRDGHAPPPPAAPIRGHDDLVLYLNDLNARFVETSRRLSPRVLIELLEWAAPRLQETARATDPYGAALFAVSWAGEVRSAAWFDLARDLTEHWHHQQQIRLATGIPLLLDPRYAVPVMDTFARALPFTYRDVPAPDGTAVAVAIAPPIDRLYALRREGRRWILDEGPAESPKARISLDGESAWRIFTGGIPRDEAMRRTVVSGDGALAAPFFDVVAVMK
ncbi:MAG: maleylpyruvate isomerase N-terminal domain-containing protein [Acidobacteriota bacterium]|nr:maleylpyruvate isomerase N-terminal domain-containing protein [Acidobacteriota bacterium]